MRSRYVLTVATAAIATLLAGTSAFAQDTEILKRKPLQQGEAPAVQQEPATRIQPSKPRAKAQAQQRIQADQPTSAEAKPRIDTGQPARRPIENAQKPALGDRNQVGQADCQPDANCPPTRRQKLGQQPANGMKLRPNVTEQTDITTPQQFGQQSPDDQALPRKKRLMGATPPEPRPVVGARPADVLPRQAQLGRARGDVDVAGSIAIAPERARRVRDTLFRSGEQTDIDVAVDVGQPLPQRVRPRPLPPEIVGMAPEYQGYDYVIVRRQIVIVEPQTQRVVEVIRQGRPTQAASAPLLTVAQRRMILDYARAQQIASAEGSLDLQSGASVPSDVELAPLPNALVAEVPAIESYEFFVTGDQVVLVDPDTRAVVEVDE